MKDAKRALFLPARPDKAWCTFATVSWLSSRTKDVSIGIPWLSVNGEETVGTWSGLSLTKAEIRVGIVEAEKGGVRFHVRLEEGERHEGPLKDCVVGPCLAERIMEE